jgi:uncharacterized phage infection (PIP) family protein YhgE
MFGKRRIWQKSPVTAERPQVNPGAPGRAEHPPFLPPAGGTGDAVTTVNQRLQQEISDRKLADDQFKIHLDRLEQRIKCQSLELMEIKDHLGCLRNELGEKIAQITAAIAQLQQQAAEREQIEKRLSEQNTELTTAAQQLQQKIAEGKESAHYLNEKLAVLSRTVQQLQHEVGQLNQKEIELLEGIIDAEQPSEQIQVLNPQELKALSELAKRLAQ